MKRIVPSHERKRRQESALGSAGLRVGSKVREVSFSTTISFYFRTTQRYRTGFLKEIAKHVVGSRQADNPL